MTLVTFKDGKVLLRDGNVGTGAACCCCVPCTCGKCVSYSFVVRGDQTLEPPPEPVTTSYTAYAVEDSCPPKQPCFDFEYIADPVEGQLGPGCGTVGNWVVACNSIDLSEENNYVFWRSEGGIPCARVRCTQAGEYLLDVCVFSKCSGAESAAGRLTRKTYAITPGEDGCPASIGAEIESSVTDWALNVGTGQWIPASDYGYDLDGTIGNARWCNQDCWAEEPFAFLVCDVVEGQCDCNEFP